MILFYLCNQELVTNCDQFDMFNHYRYGKRNFNNTE